jgi:hypothetical protein
LKRGNRYVMIIIIKIIEERGKRKEEYTEKEIKK